MIAVCFDKNHEFLSTRDKCFMILLRDQPLSPNHLAYYSHYLLKTGLKGVSEHDADQKISSIILLFCLLESRDVFLKNYGKFLGERLMNKSSWDAAFEALMVEKLRMQCGVNEKEVSKMGKMFTDMALSIDLENEFK